MFFLFEKKRRVKLAVSQFRSAQMPVPNAFYDDPVQYFLEVANSDAAPKEARLLAGAAVGTIEGLRWGNRPFLVMTTLMVLEEAISKYAETGALKSGEVDYFAGVDMS